MGGATTTMAENTFNFGAAENLSFAKCITCASEEAREVWAHGFGFMLNYNHEMAIGKYMECLEKDPKCAMAHWGIAYSLSSSYNWPPGLGSGHDSCEAANGLKEGLSEPWGQMQPVRHILGALKLEQGEVDEAEALPC